MVKKFTSKKENVSVETVKDIKKDKKKVLFIILVLSVLVLGGVGAFLLNMLKKQEPTPVVSDLIESELYWNADRDEYLPKLGGITMRKPEADGIYTVRFMVNGELVEYRVKDKKLMIEIDKQAIMGLIIDEDNFVTDVVEFDEMGVREVAKSCFVQDVDGSSVNVNTSATAEGVDIKLNIKDEVDIWNVTSTEQLGTQTHLQTLDCVRVFNKEGSGITDVFVIDREDALTGVPVEKYCEHCKEVVKWQMWIGETGLPAKEGHWRLIRDVNMKGQRSMEKGMSQIIDLNGKTVTATHKSRIIALFSEDCYLALMDLSEEKTGTLKGLGNGGHGSLVWVRYNGVFDLYSGILDGSEVVSTGTGAAVAVQNGEGTFNMYGGTIIGGKAQADVVIDEKTRQEKFTGGLGGSLFVAGTFNMYDGVIKDGVVASEKNSKGAVQEVKGGNVCIGGGATFNMYGGTISGGKLSKETLSHGGNVYLLNKAKFNMFGGVIEDGSATAQGGNVYGYNATINMSGGKIRDGKNLVNGKFESAKSSNLFLINGTFNMTGGLIEGYAFARDYGVDANGNPNKITIKLSETAQIKGGKTNLSLDLGKTIEFGTLKKGAEIYINGTGYISEKTVASNQNYVHSDLGANVLYNDNKLFVGKYDCICGQKHVTDDGKIVEEHFGACDGTQLVWFVWGNKSDLPTSTGNWYLVTDVNVNRQINIAKDADIALDLNGYTVYGTKGRRVLSLYNGNISMTLTDHSDNMDGRLIARETGDGTGYGNCIWVAKNSSLVMYGGNLDASTVHSTVEGVAIDVQKDAKFTMYGGTITGGRSDTYAGSVAAKGKFDMWGGTIQDGYAKKDGGNIYVGGEFNLYGGNILRGESEANGGNIGGRNINIAGGSVRYGKANAGGNVYCSVALKMSDGLLMHGVANYGGNAFLSLNAKLTMSGGTMRQGVAQIGTGGNLRTLPKCSVEITGGTIENGIAETNGGNIWMNGGSLKVTGGTITGGRALEGSGGNICTVKVTQGGVTEDTVINLRGGSITEGRAAVNGGNLYIQNGDLTLAGDIVVRDGINSGTKAASNMYLGKGIVAKLDALSSEAGAIGIASVNPIFATNAKEDKSDLDRFVHDNGDSILQTDARELCIGKISCMCGGHRDDKATTNGGHEEWCTVDMRNIEWRAWNDSTDLPKQAGFYYLTTDVTQAAQISLSEAGNYGLDLNGHRVTKSRDNTRLYAFWNTNNNITLNITDTSVERKGTIGLQDGLEGTYSGFLIWMRYFEGNSKHKLNLYAGTLDSENISASTVFVDKGDLSIFGGTIEGKVQISAQYGSKLNVSGSPQVAVEVSDNKTQEHGLTWTGTLSLTSDDVTEDAEIILSNLGNLDLTGTGEASSFKCIDQHNQVRDDNQDGMGALSIDVKMCVCGKSDGRFDHTPNCSKPKPWQPWNVTISKAYNKQQTGKELISLPYAAGSYYLTEDLSDLSQFAPIATGTMVNLDLAGFKAEGPGREGYNYRMNGGTLNIADSSPEQTGAIICTGESTSIYGRVVWIWGKDTADSCVNLFGGKLAAADGATGLDGVVVKVLAGTFNMYGGEIVPGTCTNGSNCITVGDGTRNSVLNVQGGTIKGEITFNSASAQVKIGGKAKVGVEQSGKAYGIGTATGVTGKVNITCNDVTSEGKVVLKDSICFEFTDGSTGDERAFTYNNKYNKVVDDSGDDGIGTLSTDVKMCVCGRSDGQFNHTPNCSKPTQPWQPWSTAISKAYEKRVNGTERICLPRETGSYYLTENIKDINQFAPIATGTMVNLDLAGFKAEGLGRDYYNYYMKGGTLNIADSSAEQTGAILCTTSTQAMFGRVIWISGNDACVNLFGGKLAAADGAGGQNGVVVRIQNGTFNMYGGEITPGTCTLGNGSNCVALGNGTNNCVLNVQGGTIKGEITLDSASAKVSIGGNAKVGVEQSGKAYGIGTATAVTSKVNITCNDVTSEGKVVLKDTNYLGFADGSTGDERAFTIIEPHNRVTDNSGGDGIGVLSLVAKMCVCGKVDGQFNHTPNCSQPATLWQPWNTAISKAFVNTQTSGRNMCLPYQAGSYYLTENLNNLDQFAPITTGTTVNLDLAGFKAEGPGREGYNYRMNGGTLNIADSSSEKTGAIICTGESTSIYGRVVWIWGRDTASSCVNLFGGKLAAADGATGLDGVVVKVLAGTFNMYDGEITPGTCANGSNCITVGDGTRDSILNVQGGTIKGEITFNSASAQVKIGGKAKVGVEQSGKAYGIGTAAGVKGNITCKDVTAEGRVVLKDMLNLGFSDGSTGDERAFTIIEPHNKVVDNSNGDGIGTLSFDARMCTCGKVGEHTQVGGCDVPDGIWKTWNSSMSSALPSETGSYYFTDDFKPSRAITLSSKTITLDLNGHTVTVKGTLPNLILVRGSSTLNITDSVGGGALVNPYSGAGAKYGILIMLPGAAADANAKVNLYGGTLTSLGGSLTDSNQDGTVYIGKGKFNMYGGVLEGNGVAGDAFVPWFGTTANFNQVGGELKD